MESILLKYKEFLEFNFEDKGNSVEDNSSTDSNEDEKEVEKSKKESNSPTCPIPDLI